MIGTSNHVSRRVGGALAMAMVLAAGWPAAAQVKQQPPRKESENEIALRQKLEAARSAGDDASAQQLESLLRAEQEKNGALGVPPPGRATQPGTGRPTLPGAQPGATGATGGTGAPRATPRPAIQVDPAPAGAGLPQPGPDEVVLPAFSEAVDLKTLVEYVAETLQISIVGNDTLTGSVVLNGPMVIKRDRLLRFLNSLLETQGFMVVGDGELPGFYKVLPVSNSAYNMIGDLASTRVIPTPTIRPSSLIPLVNDQFATTGQPMRISYIDELGIIILTDSPRRIDSFVDIVERILQRTGGQQFIPFELKHVAAAVARQRVLDLLGAPATTAPVPGQPQNQGQVVNAGAIQLTNAITNLSDRLTVDPTGNGLLFRGYPEEAVRIDEVVKVIDRPNTLKYEQYYAGKGAQQIAELAERLGLGHVETIESLPSSGGTTQAGFTPQPQQGNRNAQLLQAMQQQQQQMALAGGPVMIVDTSRNIIIYYGTDSQQAQLKSLIDKFDTDQELVTIQTYKIKNQYAEDIADVLSGIVTGQTGSDTSNPFLPGGNPFGAFQQRGNNNQQGNTRTNRSNRSTSTSGGTTSSRSAAARQQSNQQGGGNIRPVFMGGNQGRQPQAGAEGAAGLGGEDVFIMADTANNQVIVKAPKGQQEEFARLINKLDQRRPQVQIEVQIVSVTATDDFRLAIEAQALIGQFAGTTNFGLSSLTQTTPGTGTTPGVTTGGFQSRKNVATDLPGITAAFIKSNQVPLIVTALKNNFDSRILSSPQITVDDNVEATIESTDQEPTSTASQTNSSTINSFGGYEEAGTVVTVLPSISEGGYMRLNYDIELSNFVGTTNAAGFPPPKQVRHVTSESVTIPGDTTIIVGGIKVDTKTSNISKVPLLGDIPILGHLFRDTNKSNSSTRLYIFITPRILRDANFRDVLLLTEGPLRDAGLTPDIPPLEPVMMELAGRSQARSTTPVPAPAPTQPDSNLTRPAPAAPGRSSGEGF